MPRHLIKSVVTLKNVAKTAGVSLSTVSAALNNGDERYNSKTVEHVRSIARKLGYRPNRAAQAIRIGSNKLIGMIFFGGSMEVTNERARCIGQSIDELGYELLTMDIHWHKGGLSRVVDRLLEVNVSGVILAGPGTDEETLAPIFKRGIPVVGIACNHIPHISQIRADMRQGMRQMAEHLVSYGHRKIVNPCLVDPHEKSVETLRWQVREQTRGILDVIFRNGGTHILGDRETYARWLDMQNTASVPSLFTLRLARNAEYAKDSYAYGRDAAQLIGECKTLPHAISFPNDEGAAGCIGELYRRGISVPKKMAVVGFNNSFLAKNFFIPLTSVRQSIPEMARKAVEICMQQIENPEKKRARIFKIPCELVVRKSCGSGMQKQKPAILR